MKELVRQSLDRSMSFDEYTELFAKVVAEKRTTGPKQTEGYANYTKLNWARYQKSYEKYSLSYSTIEFIHNLKAPVTLIVITEAWCGDASQTLPVLEKIDATCDKVNMRVILRDENKELMSHFLTNGGEAIPKVIAINDNLEVIGDWGPRPTELQAIVKELKAKNPDATGAEISKMTEDWYNEDKGKSTQKEILGMINKVNEMVAS